jgi:hypothetical protein
MLRQLQVHLHVVARPFDAKICTATLSQKATRDIQAIGPAGLAIRPARFCTPTQSCAVTVVPPASNRRIQWAADPSRAVNKVVPKRYRRAVAAAATAMFAYMSWEKEEAITHSGVG